MTVPARLVHLIDDDGNVRDALSFLLRAAGYRVLAHDSGMGFLETVPDNPEGCVVTDVRMPGLNGIELTAQLRGLGIGLPVIVMSGRADLSLALLAVRAGAVDFLDKPFDGDMLLEALERAFSRSPPPAPETAATARSLGKLEARERDLLNLLLLGRDRKEIAAHFGLEPRALERWCDRVVAKTQSASLPSLLRTLLLARLPVKDGSG
jgi:two-component system, LuxR family, response regulator FixJ